jgi:hypothetical protein
MNWKKTSTIWILKRLVSLKNSNISEVNKQLISDFVENCYAQGLGQSS